MRRVALGFFYVFVVAPLGLAAVAQAVVLVRAAVSADVPATVAGPGEAGGAPQ